MPNPEYYNDYFEINGVPFSNLVFKGGMKVDYETLVADTSGRNAQGDMTVDVINHKYKVGVTFRPLTPTELLGIMNAISNYVVSIKFMDPRTGDVIPNAISCYTSTPSVTWNTLVPGKARTNTFTINFIQL